MTITALTAACSRPEAWALSERYMARQTRQPDQWLVLDDGEQPSICTMGQDYYYLPHCRGRGSMTRKLAIAFASGLVRGDACIIWENDDYMAPTWIGWCDKHLVHSGLDLVGEGLALYYNVRRRWWFEHANMRHASLCSTAFTRAVYPTVIALASNPDPFIDDRLWRRYPGKKKVFANSPRLVVGIKDVPGVGGYGSGHGEAGVGCHHDQDMRKLKEQIGEDARLYEGFYHA